eukprot:841906-Prorocentrum_minimum.AAC.1
MALSSPVWTPPVRSTTGTVDVVGTPGWCAAAAASPSVVMLCSGGAESSDMASAPSMAEGPIACGLSTRGTSRSTWVVIIP